MDFVSAKKNLKKTKISKFMAGIEIFQYAVASREVGVCAEKRRISIWICSEN